MGKLFCLFVCYGGHELRCAMDGGRGNYIEDGLVEGTEKANIRGNMRETEEALLGMCFGWVVVVF